MVKTPLGPCDQLSGKKLISPCRRLFKISLHSSNNLNVFESTTAILEQEFAHFGYPHTLVTDNATTFMSQEFQAWCKQRGKLHLTGAPYHPATNGAAERLIQSFKQALRKSSLPPKEALQEFLMQYRRIPFASGLSPRRQASKHSNAEDSEVVSKVEHHYSLGDPCYALYFGPRRDRDPRWVPVIP